MSPDILLRRAGLSLAAAAIIGSACGETTSHFTPIESVGDKATVLTVTPRKPDPSFVIPTVKIQGAEASPSSNGLSDESLQQAAAIVPRNPIEAARWDEAEREIGSSTLLNTVLANMDKTRSSNPYLIEAKDFIDVHNGKALNFHSVQGMSFATAVEIDGFLQGPNTQLSYKVQINTDANPRAISFELVHDMAFLAKLSEQARSDPFSLRNPYAFVFIEAYALSRQAEAYIIALGQGYKGLPGSEFKDRAINYLNAGRRWDAPGWIDYTANYMGQPNQQPRSRMPTV